MFITSRCSSFNCLCAVFEDLYIHLWGKIKCGEFVWFLVWLLSEGWNQVSKWRWWYGRFWLFWLFYVITRFLYFPQTLKSVCVNISDNDRSNMNLWSDEQWGGKNLKISEVAYFGVLSLVPHVEIFSWCFLWYLVLKYSLGVFFSRNHKLKLVIYWALALFNMLNMKLGLSAGFQVKHLVMWCGMFSLKKVRVNKK